MTDVTKSWDGAAVRKWLDSRILAARADQAAAEKSGRRYEDDCDKAAAEEMICASLQSGAAADDQTAFSQSLKALLDREDYVWRGVYDDTRFERHVRGYVRKLIKMAKANTGFENLKRYQ